MCQLNAAFTLFFKSTDKTSQRDENTRRKIFFLYLILNSHFFFIHFSRDYVLQNEAGLVKCAEMRCLIGLMRKNFRHISLL